MVKKTKGLFFITACLVHIGASAMEVTEQQAHVEQVRLFPTLRHLCNQTLAPSLVKGSPLYRTVDTKKLRTLEERSMIPADLIPGLRYAAQEYRAKHPGALPIVANTTLNITDRVMNQDLMPQAESVFDSWEVFDQNHPQMSAAIDRFDQAFKYVARLRLAGFFAAGILNCTSLKSSDYMKSFNNIRSKIGIVDNCRLILGFLPPALYCVSKPESRKYLLASASAGFVGYGMYKGLKK